MSIDHEKKRNGTLSESARPFTSIDAENAFLMSSTGEISAATDEKLNILLVDDNPGKLLAHETVLSSLGENVITAASGTEALQKLLRDEFAVILLDVNMPAMDGFETAELIRQRPRFEKTPIIFVTGYNTTDIDRLRGYQLGAVDYLFLPIVPEVLKAKVKAFVDLARQNRVIRHQAEHLAENNAEQARQLKIIQDLNRSLMETNRELESFSYTVSHDLRAPLRALRGFSTFLLEDYGDSLDETATDCVKRIHQAAITLDHLTHDLLEYSHISREEVRISTVQLEGILEDVLRMNPGLRPPSAVIETAGKLHPVRANPSLLLHCLGNLVANAAKFVSPGVIPHIVVSTELEGDRVRIWVKDNGIGIDPASHKRIFGLFERVGDVRRYEGTGVGLAIVARAVGRMGGSYGVESAAGAGSRFWIQLPSAEDAPEPAGHYMPAPERALVEHQE